jgi:hypothetical protein
MNTERSLAHIEEITEICPIQGKDRIVTAKVLGWSVVIGKDEFRVGDKVVYIEIDSRLNTNIEVFAALKRDADKYGFALIKTRKFGDVFSQGICFRVPKEHANSKPGTDLTAFLNKEKDGNALAIIHNEEYADRKAEWERPVRKKPKFLKWKRVLYRLFPRLKREKKGPPSPYDIGVSKTDEERIQNRVELFERLRAEQVVLVATEKIDGQSFTAHMDAKGKVYVASRNIPLYFADALREKQSETYAKSTWQAAFDKYGIKAVLEDIQTERKAPATIQGELIGRNIQGNPYKIAEGGVQLRVFNIVIDGKKVPFHEMEEICLKHGLETVPYIGAYTIEKELSIEEFIAKSDGPSAVNKEVIREGIVYRTEDYRLSFKVISNRFLLKRGE